MEPVCTHLDPFHLGSADNVSLVIDHKFAPPSSEQQNKPAITIKQIIVKSQITSYNTFCIKK